MNEKKKISLIGTQPPVIGGISTHVHTLNKRLEQNGYEVTVIDVVNKKKEAGTKGINPFNLILQLLRLSNSGYTIFHFHTSRRAYPFLLCILMLKILNKKAILSIHHGDFNKWLVKSFLRKFIYTTFFSLADKLIFMNSKEAKKFKKKSSIDGRRVMAIHPFIVEDETLYDKTHLIKDNKKLFKVTTMGLWKGYYSYEDVIEACVNFNKRSSTITVLDIVVGTIYSDSKYREKIFDLVRQKSNSRCKINIIEDKDDVLAYLKGRDVLVRSSKVDSYGICVAEALLVGTPAVATNVCARPVNTQLYKPHDIKSLIECLKNIEQHRQNITSQGSLITKEDDSYYQLENIYQELI
jgi:glycosyltransferase involved in cell wall biosynthesis